jgi:hypothetical protein
MTRALDPSPTPHGYGPSGRATQARSTRTPDPGGETLACRKCGGPVPAQAGPGRPAAYCSKGCRRAREYELRRLERALFDVEEQIRACRFGWNGRTSRDEPKFEAERVRLEDRLRVLLDEPEDPDIQPDSGAPGPPITEGGTA